VPSVGLREYLDNAILKEEQGGCVITRLLENVAFLKLLTFQVVDQVVQGVI